MYLSYAWKYVYLVQLFAVKKFTRDFKKASAP